MDIEEKDQDSADTSIAAKGIEKTYDYYYYNFKIVYRIYIILLIKIFYKVGFSIAQSLDRINSFH